LQHIENVLDYMSSGDYQKESLEETSKKIKLCNSKNKKKEVKLGERVIKGESKGKGLVN
jgi:hypothetical protein